MMSEAVAAEGADALPEPRDVEPCAPDAPASPPPCAPDDCERRHDNKKPERQLQKHCDQVHPKKKVKAKGKLVRSMAVCDEFSPAPEEITASPDSDVSPCRNDNERTSCKEEEQSADPKKLSKESGAEYTDSTGIDLHRFIVDTLNSNPRDRMMLLKLEQDMIDFITSKSPFKKFPHMSSYHRMLVHRVAAYFGMEHNVDQTGKAVIINRTGGTRIPEQRFSDEVHRDKSDEMCWKVILKRDSSSDEPSRSHPLRERQSKSMEEREEEYQRARDRIFNPEPLCTQENVHAEPRAVEDYNPYAETQRRRLLYRKSRDNSGSSWTGSSVHSSTETDYRYGNEPPPWSSTDSDSSYQWTSPAPQARPPAVHGWEARGTGSIPLFRLPPTCPHAPSPPIREEPTQSSAFIMENGIPPGSILVNPHTGQPFLNPDGSPAVYNPPDGQQPIRSQTQLQGAEQQQQPVLQYSSVSYTAPQMLPVAPSQPYPTVEDLSSQYAHVTVSCPSAGDAPPLYPPTQGYIYAAPPPPAPPPPPPPNASGYCQPSPQMPVYFYGQYPTSAQNGCRPVSPGQHSQVAQPTGYAPAAAAPPSSHPQAQAVLGTYSPMVPHQCSVVQGGVPLSHYPQSKMVGGGEVGYCCVAPSHHGGCHPPGRSLLAAPPAWSAQY